MKKDNLENILSNIDEKTLGDVLDEREKRLNKIEEEKTKLFEETDQTETLVIEEAEEESRGERIRKGVFKALSVAAAIVLIAGIVYVVRIPLYMNGKEPTPAASGTAEYHDLTAEDFSEWIDPDRTDRISMEDVEKIEAGMSFKELVDLLGKPTGDVGSGEIIMKWMIDNGNELLVTLEKPLSAISSVKSSDVSITPGDLLIKSYTTGEKTVYFNDPAPYIDEETSAFTLQLLTEDDLKFWADPERTDKISMADVAMIKEGMLLKDVVDLIGKPVGIVGELRLLSLTMEWEIDNGAALHVSIGSMSSYVQTRQSIGDFGVASCEIKHGPAVIYTPDYDSTSTLHADVFLEKLKNEGYHRDGGMDTSYNVEGIESVYNITPPAILSEEPDLEIFYLSGTHCFMMYKGEIYRFDTFGGYHYRLVLWDYDGNGIKDLVSYFSWGSGIPRLSVSVYDLTTMKGHAVITREVLREPAFSFDFDGENVYIDGEILTYSDGEFHCGDLF